MAGPSEQEAGFRERARLSLVWQELATPVRAIVGYQEIIVEEGERLGLTDLAPYLDKVLVAARTLNDLVDGLKDGGTAHDNSSDHLVDLQSRIRHDLRTPLNAIIGYSEMVIEDLDAHPAAAGLQPDIEKLLQQARQLLGQIDSIVDFTRLDARLPAAHSGTDGAQDDVIADLLKTLRPERANKSAETGRILIVDDNESNRDLLGRRLLHEGHQVTAVDSGEAALAAVENDSFDLVLLDLLMPGMNGIEVLERLKADPRYRDTPVIMISGLTETDAVIRCIEAGAEDYLPKPFNPVLLRARISSGLERKRWRDRERDYLASISAEKEKSDALLRNILPDPVVTRLNSGESVIADRFDDASILFADIVGFTPVAAAMAPSRLVEKLNSVFTEFDILAAELGIEKIKTIGDAYMAASGLPEKRQDHAEIMIEFAVAMLRALERTNADDTAARLEIRIGVHSGPVVAGIIGRHKFIYDVWGDTVNFASRLEAHGLPGRIQVSAKVKDAVSHKFRFERRGMIALKGKGRTATFLLSHAL